MGKQPEPELYISNTLNNRRLYEKAYLIEFYSADKNEPEDVFTFSIPPENEEITYTQRKTETKTFGSLHVDEYGIDAAKITLSGSTVNQSLKRIYIGNKGNPKWLSGEDEIYLFRDLIKKHRSIGRLCEKENTRIIKIYDLSKVPSANSYKTSGGIKNCWQAYPGDFKIRRSSDRPFTYKYSFEFTGVALEDEGGIFFHEEPEPEKWKVIEKMMEALKTAMGHIDQANAVIDNIDRQIEEALNKVYEVRDLLELLGRVMSAAADTFTRAMIDTPGKAVAGAIDRGAGIVDSARSAVAGAKAIISIPKTIELKVLNAKLEIQNAAGRLTRATDALAKDCREFFSAYDAKPKLPKEILDQYEMDDQEFRDTIDCICNKMENASNELAAAAKSTGIPDVTAGNPDPATGSQRIVLSYGYSSVVLKSADTLESLANEYLGSPDKAIDIASFNNVASLNDLKPGDKIRLPITRRTPKMANNLIYARHEDRDNYGRGILLTDDGFTVASNTGDYELTSGADNLAQAVLLRLRESVNKRIRINAYGIRANIGDPAAGRAYIISSINQTVSKAPRVSAVTDIQFSSKPGYSAVHVVYTDINNAGGSAGGKV